jgi:hypothetical protein
MPAVMTFLVLALTFVAACKKESGGGDAIATMTRFRDAMCACADKTCIEKVSEEHRRSGTQSAPATAKSQAEDQKLADIYNEMIKCMTRIASEAAGSGAAGSGAAGSGAAAGSAGAGAGSAAGGAGQDVTATGAAGGASAGSGGTMAHRAGNCPSTVLGATTKATVKGRTVMVAIESTDKDAIAAIQRRTDELLAEKKDGVIGTAHDAKGTYGGSRGLCPVHVPEGATATAKRQARGVVVTITPKDKPEELAKDIEDRIVRAADWVKTNVPPGDRGNQGGVGGGKGQDGSNHSGKGDGKGRERRNDGTGGGTGTGGGGGKGTGGGGGGGTGGGSGKATGAGKDAAGGAGSGGW